MKIINVMAASLDGCIATEKQEADQQRLAQGFTSEEDREFVRQQIHGCDAIVTGADSMRASRKAWNEVGRKGEFPHWFVLSNRGLDEDLEFWQQEKIPRYLVSKEQLKPPAARNGAQNLVYGAGSASECIVSELRKMRAEVVLLFGGGQVNREFYKNKFVDELKITFCPLIVGREGAPQFVSPGLPDLVYFNLVSSKVSGNHVFLHYVTKEA